MGKSKGILFYSKWILGILLLLIFTTILAFRISVRPGVYIISRMFNQPVTILDKDAFRSVSPEVSSIKNIPYDSDFNNSTMDIYFPNGIDKARGILLWLHGGGFVAGDKNSIEEFATYIAAHNQIAVVPINYEKAPRLTYPGQIYQLDNAYEFLKNHHSEYLSLDFTKILFGGDSAGGQIAGQYVALQTNKNYAKEFQFTPSIPAGDIIGFISYSAPVNLLQMADAKSDSFFMKFFVNTVARAFIGTRNWKNSDILKQASVAEHVTIQFPPSFITDGNTYSFQEQGQALEKKLKSLDIPVESLFYADSEKEIPHEYQFDYRTKEARDCLQKTIRFIDDQFAYLQ